jgi:hypothetical protein
MVNKRFFVSAALAGLMPFAATAARADLSVVTEVKSAMASVAGGKPSVPSGAGARSESVQTYYKGRRMRTEAGNRVMIYDGVSGASYQIDPAAKTYSVVPSAASNPITSMLHITTKATVGPTGATKIIIGHSAREYAFTADVDMASAMTGFRAGGVPGHSAAPAVAKPQHIGTVHIKGREWVVVVPTLPSGGSDAMQAGMQKVGTMVPGMKNLMDKIAAIKGIPVASEEAITMEFVGMGALFGSGGGAPTRMATTVTIEATAFHEGPLPDSLFAVPAGYTRVDRPKFIHSRANRPLAPKS